MKNFFDKSNWKIKLLLHVIMFIFILVVIPLVSSSFETSIGYFIWFLVVIIEVCFIILSVKSFINHIGEEKTINKQIEKTEEILNNNEKEY